MVDTAFLHKIFLFRDLTEDEMKEILRRTQTPKFSSSGRHH